MGKKPLIQHEFVMTDDAIPVPVKKGIWRQCKNCHKLAKRIVKGLCNRCELYKLEIGNTRPKRLHHLKLLCSNPNCRKILKYDSSSKAGKCCACYKYATRRTGVENRPLRLCKRHRKQNV